MFYRLAMLALFACAFPVLATEAAEPQPEPPALAGKAHQVEPQLLTRSLPGKNLTQVSQDLKRAVANNNYTFVREQAIDSRLVPVEWEARSVLILYFCNFARMDRALSLDTRAAQLMPCRITLVETASGVDIAAVNPAWQSQEWANPALHEECQALKHDYEAILEEVML